MLDGKPVPVEMCLFGILFMFLLMCLIFSPFIEEFVVDVTKLEVLLKESNI